MIRALIQWWRDPLNPYRHLHVEIPAPLGTELRFPPRNPEIGYTTSEPGESW